MDLGIIQITNSNTKRLKLLIDKLIPFCVEKSGGKYTLVSPENPILEKKVLELGANFSLYTAWDKDMSRKWRQGISTRPEEWLAFFADDILPSETWFEDMKEFLKNKLPGQYGFRLVDENDKRHEHGEDWMQWPSRKYGYVHRPLDYNIETGYLENSKTAYVANCVVHRDVLKQIEPFGVYKAAPDVMWSLAIREYGFPIGFNIKAKAYHLGDRKDNR
jgi:GT2 family glycosyltransferase